MTFNRLLLAGLLIAWAGILVVGFYSSSLEVKLRGAESQAERARVEKEEAIQALDIAKRSAAASIHALEAIHKAEQARTKTMNVLRGDIHAAPNSDDAPIAPVLRRALDGLRSE